MEDIVGGMRDNFAGGETGRFILLGALKILSPRPSNRKVMKVKTIKR